MAAISIDACAALAAACRARGEGVVAACGVFDLLHAGHTGQLAAARTDGDVLVALVLADPTAKGPSTAALATPAAERAEIVAALASVDAAVVVDAAALEAALAQLQPDVLVVFAEASVDEDQARAVMARHGGRLVVLAAAPEWSTPTRGANARRRS